MIDGLGAEMAGLLNGSGSPNASTANGGFGLGSVLGGMDMSKVSDSGPGGPLIPKDTYVEAKIVGMSAAKSKQGNPMLVPELVVYYPVEYAGKKMKDWVTLTQEALWKFKSMAKATDLLSEDGATYLGGSERDFIGKAVGFTVIEDTYNGRTNNKISGGYEAVQYLDEQVIPGDMPAF